MKLQTLKDFLLPPIPNDLCKKDIFSQVVKIAWPAIVELTLVQLCSVVDTIMVGKLGSSALASVGYCTQPRFLLLAAFIALSSGSTALIARFKGAEEKDNANLALTQSIILSIILSLILSVIGFIFSRQMVIFMGAESEKTINSATSYMQIQMLGFVFNAVTLAITAGLRGIGKTKVSMYYNLAANVFNVIFNYLLIYGKFGFPRMEVAGASLATVIGQILAFIMAFIVILNKKAYLHINLKDLFKIDFSMWKRILNIGIPAMFEQVSLRIGLIIYTLTVTSLGETLYATHQIGLNIMSISFMNGQAFGIAAASLLGQSMGMNRIDKGKAYTYECRKLGMIVSLTLSCIFIFLRAPIIELFSSEREIIIEGSKIMIILAINQPIQASQLILSGALRGAGDTKTVAAATLIGMLFIRPFSSIVAVKFLGLGLLGAWTAVILDQIIRSIITYIRFAGEKWQHIKV